MKDLLRTAEYDGLDLTTLHRPGIPKNLRTILDRYVVGSGLTESELETRSPTTDSAIVSTSSPAR